MFEKILVAVDGSDHANKATPVVIDIAKTRKAEVVVMHAIEHEHPRGPVARAEAPEEAKRVTETVVRALKSAGIPVRGEVVTTTPGKIAHAIVDTAKDENAGLIIMGSRGLSDIEGLLLGSVTHKVLQHADRPVLVIR
ncbi:MAG TPA: universal stress protein [Candidatus Dormibacteraeota bacterium]|nr:universal stress protein [Candidatus Dormibacteraeota bacterium]